METIIISRESWDKITRISPFNRENVRTPLLLTPTARFATLVPFRGQKLRKVGAQHRGGTTSRWGEGSWGRWHQNSAEIARPLLPLPPPHEPAPVSGLRVLHEFAADNRGEAHRQETPRCKLSAEGKWPLGSLPFAAPAALPLFLQRFLQLLCLGFSSLSAQPLPRPFLALRFYDTDSPDGKSLQLKPVQAPHPES